MTEQTEAPPLTRGEVRASGIGETELARLDLGDPTVVKGIRVLAALSGGPTLYIKVTTLWPDCDRVSVESGEQVFGIPDLGDAAEHLDEWLPAHLQSIGHSWESTIDLEGLASDAGLPAIGDAFDALVSQTVLMYVTPDGAVSPPIFGRTSDRCWTGWEVLDGRWIATNTICAVVDERPYQPTRSVVLEPRREVDDPSG